MNVTASEQNDSFGYGPSYLLTGATNKDYWYEIGFSWNHAYLSVGHEVGFHFTYEVHDPNGTEISSNNAANPQTTAFFGSSNDVVLLKLALLGSNITMYARDLNDNASFVSSYPGFGATHFIRSYENSQNIVFPSSAYMSWYHANPSQCERYFVSFTWLPNTIKEYQICVDEWNFTNVPSPYLLTNQTGYGFPTECTTSPSLRYAVVNASVQGNSFVID